MLDNANIYQDCNQISGYSNQHLNTQYTKSFPNRVGNVPSVVGAMDWLADRLLGGFQVLVLAVKQLFPDFEFMWLVDEAKKNLPLELDFLNEGRNAEKVAHMLKHFDFLKVGGQDSWG